MRRELVFDSRIAQAYDQFHPYLALSSSALGHWLSGCGFQHAALTRCSGPSDRGVHQSNSPQKANDERPITNDYFFSFFSPFSGAASAPSSSGSCLPFFITSGSAGVAAASPATASAVGATSSLIEMTWATGWFSSVRNLSFSLCGKSETRMTLPNTSSLT